MTDFEAVYRQYFSDVELYLRAICHDGHLAEELTEQVFFQALKALPEKYRLVIHLYYYEDNSLAQISTILGITQAAKQRLSRGRKLLKSTLMEEWNDDE